MVYEAEKSRYEKMQYNRCGKNGLKLPAVSLGMWHNFGSVDSYENSKAMALKAFDLGITHFDLANNYGPEPGSAELTMGNILSTDLGVYRDELLISTKAGFLMWDGPYGEWGSRKYVLASLDQSLKRMGLEYVDIFYSHRPDPETPLEETMGALDTAVRQGKALYAGISNYPPELTRQAAAILKDLGTPCLIHQKSYSMFNREAEEKLFDVLNAKGIGCIAFCPLAQGLLAGKYLEGIPENSRAAKKRGMFTYTDVDEKKVAASQKLNSLARERGQTLAQMALAWALRIPQVCSVLIGASRAEQIVENIKAFEKTDFSPDELAKIDSILKEAQ